MTQTVRAIPGQGRGQADPGSWPSRRAAAGRA